MSGTPSFAEGEVRVSVGATACEVKGIVVDAPPTSRTNTLPLKEPADVNRWLPVTVKTPLDRETVPPARADPSPQLMTAPKSLGLVDPPASVNVPTVASGTGVPTVAATGWGDVGVSGASAIVAVPWAMVVLPPLSVTLTVILYVPSSA